MATTIAHPPPSALAPPGAARRGAAPCARSQRAGRRSPRATRARSPCRCSTPILFALVIAPALKAALGGLHTGIDYTAFVAVGTVGLLVPLATIFAGLSVIVDRDSGAQRELLAAPVPRALLVLGNLVVVLGLCALQIVVLHRRRRAARRRLPRHAPPASPGSSPPRSCSSSLMYGIAETLAGRIHQQEEYIGATPAIAILPWFFAGALFPIGALPGRADRLREGPAAHPRAGAMRYGLVDPRGTGLHDIWGMSNTTAEAWLSLGVVAAVRRGAS